MTVPKSLLLGRARGPRVGRRRVLDRCSKIGIPSVFTGSTFDGCWNGSRERSMPSSQGPPTSAWLSWSSGFREAFLETIPNPKRPEVGLQLG
jgi:hypothetical protein